MTYLASPAIRRIGLHCADGHLEQGQWTDEAVLKDLAPLLAGGQRIARRGVLPRHHDRAVQDHLAGGQFVGKLLNRFVASHVYVDPGVPARPVVGQPRAQRLKLVDIACSKQERISRSCEPVTHGQANAAGRTCHEDCPGRSAAAGLVHDRLTGWCR